MKKSISLAFPWLMVLLLCACTIDVAPPDTPAGLATSFSSIETAPPTASNLPWSNLQLSGRLLYTAISKDGDAIGQELQVLDLATGETKTIFTTTSNAWIYYVAVSPDGKQVIMSYVPPSQTGSEAETSLYVMPLDGTTPPQILFTPPTPADRYIQVEWSPDGNYIYYVHYNHDKTPNQFYQTYHIFRMVYPDGQPEKILEQAFWPRISPDSSKIVYVSLDPATGINELFLANADGSDPQQIALSGLSVQEIIDAPIFSPDAESILFSVPTSAESYQPNWFDKLTGVIIAKAHTVPSDWWSVPITGGSALQLTQIQATGLFADIAPDQKYYASASQNGVFVMSPDGSDLTYLISPPGGITGTVRWIP